MERKYRHRVICFGEVLWDILPSGPVPGGAPMNVAYHLHKMEKNPALITKIGNDEEGRVLTDIFFSHGICTDYFQVDDVHETGKVFAQPNEQDEMVYDIVKPVAWDYIEWKNEYAELVSQADYFVYGSLAARSRESKKTLLRLLEAATKKILDINLRPPHYDRKIVEELLASTDFLKINLNELDLISSWYADFTGINEMVSVVADKFNIQNIVVTMGGEGAFLYMDGNTFNQPGLPVRVKDTVGSGDSFLAGLLSKLMENEKPQDALAFANGLGAFIATQRGACPEYQNEDVLRMIKEKTEQRI